MIPKLTNISRRDFLNGVSLTIAAGVTPAMLVSCGREEVGLPPIGNDHSYPPGLTGLRGSHPGSFEISHELAQSGSRWNIADLEIEESYDLVVVGGGISGLSAAYYYQKRFGSDARILILDNHDDFGGHAKRNEFTVDGKTLIGYGGSMSLDSPADYSATTKQLIADLGIETERFYAYFDSGFAARHNLNFRNFFDQAHYGVDQLSPSIFQSWSEEPEEAEARAAIDAAPFSEAERDAMKRLAFGKTDYLAGKSIEAKIDYLRSKSYLDYLRDDAGMPEAVLAYCSRLIMGLWGAGWDVLSALEGARVGLPGTAYLGIQESIPGPYDGEEPYIFHFPDGNASLARLLVRRLAPNAIRGKTMEDIVGAKVDYDGLDRDENAVRIRLSSTAVSVKNNVEEDGVDVGYVDVGGDLHRLRTGHVVMACYAQMLPHLCPEMQDEQKEAISYPEKIPLVYVNVALRNWRAFKNAECGSVFAPQAFFTSTRMDFPVSMGGYDYTSEPDDPTVIIMHHFPMISGQGETMKEQARNGQRQLFQLTFDDFEREVVGQLTAMFGSYGFDAEKDIAGITVNRWPHGYAYEYNELEDDWSFNPENGPHIDGRAPIGRITMANSDSQAYAYLDGAIDAAARAVKELPA